MSKKIAEGTGALVLDVKVGSGAFMKNLGDARELARTMVELGEDEGLHTTALLTRMDVPLGRTAGNALEVREAVEVLAGGGPSDVVELTLALAREMLAAVGRDDVDPADRLRDGTAMDRWRAMIAAQGGDPDAPLPAARYTEELRAPGDGVLAELDAMAVGVAAWRLGAGRERQGEPVQAAAGIELHAKPGGPGPRRGHDRHPAHRHPGEVPRRDGDPRRGRAHRRFRAGDTTARRRADHRLADYRRGMTEPATTLTEPALRTAPKVLLHDHLDGGLRPGTVLELAEACGYRLPAGTEPELARWFRDSADSGSLERYLETFAHTVAVMQTPDGLERVARECVLDLAADGVVYAEVRFAPEQHLERGLDLDSVVEHVLEGFRSGGVRGGGLRCPAHPGAAAAHRDAARRPVP